ncbi:GNAT family N-acetyltransferase [Glutamicibacter sp. MNS18]|uniref:GNAT family N-acetyltransferase n=1 Tax=Glutamicibacter sp. MNS18 TaxID=2989817 RepID=UPI002235ED22|nr:GNAT family N-acetyltransferase [Glutamicibacter sp. MNS18]MCW4464543.1 GNAT family N-acetyltransferase [Glutamicibacter sp. MNS18]
MGSSEPGTIRVEIFGPEMPDGVPSARAASFSRAIARGFYEPESDDAEQKTLTELDVADQTVYIAAYDQDAVAPSLHADVPVGTYLAFPGTINVGGPALLPVNQISAVTVTPAYRRRGILRAMITADLQRAVDARIPLAALTASEATIYGRFGFGRVTERVRFELDVSTGARMRAPSTGTVIELAPSALEGQVCQLLAAQHRNTHGSLSNASFDYGQATGRWQNYQDLKPARDLRAALHLDGQGQPDGFMTYRFAGWDQEPAQMKIAMLCASTPAVRRDLVEYLGDHDLIKKVTGYGPVGDVLPSALVDSRSYKVLSLWDHLWLRILDLPAALAGRGYLNDGSIRLKVVDRLGHAAGTWLVEVSQGQGNASRLPEASDFDAQLDVRDLATLYLGTRSASHLAGAGVLEAGDPAILDTLDRIFSTRTTPYCYTDF